LILKGLTIGKLPAGNPFYPTTAAWAGFRLGGNPFAIALLTMVKNIMAVRFGQGSMPLGQFFRSELAGMVN
jgi:hypothetical protein